MTKRKLSPFIAAALLALASGQALAQSATTGGSTVGAVNVRGSGFSSGSATKTAAILNIINGSGLSQPYTSGVTNFDTWVASTTHDSSIGSVNASTVLHVEPVLSFDLGAVHNIDGLAWFQAPGRGGTVNRIKVYADDDFDPSNGNTGLLLDTGMFVSPTGSTRSATLPNVFSFAQAAQTSYLHLELTYVGISNPATYTTTFGEVVFREASVSAVPEPGTYALMLAGLGAVGFMARRRRSA